MTGQTTSLVLSQALPPRVLADWRTPRGVLSTRTLEDVRDEIRTRRRLQDPRDLERSHRALHVRFGNGTDRRATAQFLTADGLDDTVYHFTRDGLGQLISDALPGGWNMDTIDALVRASAGHRIDEFTDYHDDDGRLVTAEQQLAKARERGSILATASYAEMTMGNNQVRMFRTIRGRDTATGDVLNLIRAVRSTSYGTVDNLELVEAVLRNRAMRNLPVVEYRETDRHLRLRFLDDPQARIEPGHKVGIFELWNSETGHKRYGLDSGIFELICTNGMHRYTRDLAFAWYHRSGATDQFEQQIDGAVEEIRFQNSEMAETYDRALTIAVDDITAWVEETLGGRLTQEQVARVNASILEPPVNEAGTPMVNPNRLLTSVVDAVTLQAQAEIDSWRQHQMEMEADYALRRGLDRAVDGRLHPEPKAAAAQMAMEL